MSAPRRTPQVAEVLDDLTAHTGAEPHEALASRLDALAALAERPAPAPGPELAALLDGAAPLGRASRAPGRRRRTRGGAFTAAAAVLALGAGTGAAAANALPDPVQRVVAVFSEHFLPFRIPQPVRPAHRVPAGPASPTDAAVGGAPGDTSPASPGGNVVAPPHGDDRATPGGHRSAPAKPGTGPTTGPLPLAPDATGLPLPEPSATASPGATDPSAGPTGTPSADPSPSPSVSPSADPSASPSDGASDGSGRVHNPGDGTEGAPPAPSPTAGASPSPSAGATAPSWAITPFPPTS